MYINDCIAFHLEGVLLPCVLVRCQCYSAIITVSPPLVFPAVTNLLPSSGLVGVNVQHINQIVLPHSTFAFDAI